MFKALKSLIAGLAAGTALGILFSPKKGEEVRKTIKNEIKGGGSGLSAVKDTLVSMGKDIGDTCKDCYEDVKKTDEFKQGKEGLKKAYKKHVPAKTRDKVQKIIKKIKKSK